MGLKILGTGSAIPAQILTNDQLTQWLETSDEWISTRTGIRERRVLTTESVTDLAVKAARLAIEDAGIEASELDLILAPTLGGDFITPTLSCMVQRELGASCPAMDLNAACTGFVYALDVADCYLLRGRAKKILIVAAEGMSRILDWEDRATCVLFGDGAGAAVVGDGENLLSIHLTAAGAWEPLYVPFPVGNCPVKGERESPPYLKMQGQEVYKFAVSVINRDLNAALEAAGVAPEEVDHVILHQANLRIIEAAQKRSPIPNDRFVSNIDRFGNTSAASVPLLLDEMSRSGKLKTGDIIALCAFGAGMTTGACVLRWSR